MSKVFTTLRNNWKKSVFFSACGLYAAKFFYKWHRENLLMKEFCLLAKEYGRQTIKATERPRKLIVFLNPAAKDGKTKYLLEKHVLPILHLAGIEIHVVRTEHEGQAKAYMGVLDNTIVDGIVIAGGDGTLSEIVTGLLRRTDNLASRIPIGVLPFGNTNSYATELFPKKELEVQRFCEATMAIVKNNIMKADVLEVSPQDSSAPAAKKVYLMSHINWGIHSELDKQKSKYWYYPGPLKQYYCYVKQAVFKDWPPYVSADVETVPPCDGCCRCIVANNKAPADTVSTNKNIWYQWFGNRKFDEAKKPDPRLQIENPECGKGTRLDMRAQQMCIKLNRCQGDSSSMEVSYYPPPDSKLNFITRKDQSPTEHAQKVHASEIKISPHDVSQNPHNNIQYIMDSEKFEALPARVKVLQDQILVYKY